MRQKVLALRQELGAREKALELARRTVERLTGEKGQLEAGAAGALHRAGAGLAGRLGGWPQSLVVVPLLSGWQSTCQLLLPRVCCVQVQCKTAAAPRFPPVSACAKQAPRHMCASSRRACCL